MSMTPEAALGAARNYVNSTLDTLGAVKGAPCTIKSVSDVTGGKKITFEWTGTSGTKETTDVVVPGYDDTDLKDSINEISSDIDGIKTKEVVVTTKNKLDTSKSTLGSYISTSSGTIRETTYYDTSDFIDISGFENSVCISPRVYRYLFYDSNKTGIASTYYKDSIITNAVLEIPEGAAYIRISYPKSNALNMQVEDGTACTDFIPYENTVKKLLEDGVDCVNAETKNTIKEMSGNILYGKKWCCVGDSFTHGGTFTDVPAADVQKFDSGRFIGEYKVYPYLIAERNNMALQKMFESGRTLGTPENSTFTNCFTIDGVYNTIDSDVDYITIYLGINDFHHSSYDSGHANSDGEDSSGVIELGTETDTSRNTFYGAWNFVLTYLLQNYPTAKIGIIVTNGIPSYPQFREATIAMAKKYGIPYIDLNGDERTPAMHRSSNSNIPNEVKTILLNKWACNPSTNTHPNFKAHAFESTIIENFLRSL